MSLYKNRISDKTKNRISKSIEILSDGILIIVVMVIFRVLVQVLYFESFTIPSHSMNPTVIPGDRIVVNKLIMGGRIYDIYKPYENDDFPIYRLPAWGKIKHNDPIVFNFPYKYGWDSICMNPRIHYFKRCVALPGDTFYIRNCKAFAKNGEVLRVGYKKSQDDLQKMITTLANSEVPRDKWHFVMNAYPNNKEIPWTIQNFGPILVPRKGDSIALNHLNLIVYKNAIEWESKKKLSEDSLGSILLGGRLIRNYTFSQNYYFTLGDRAENSRDSRYWGLLPEKFIIGIACFIWDSEDRQTKEKRWNRIGRPLTIN